MARLDTSLDLSSSLGFDNIKTRINNAWQRLAKLVNGNLTFGNPTSGADNINGVWVTLTTPAIAGTAFNITHNLNRVPAGWIVATKTAACDVYLGGAMTSTLIPALATAGGVTLNIFVF